MPQQTFANYHTGINRQKLRGNAQAATFWDLVNCYVTSSGTIRKRPGFRLLGTLDASSKGLFANNGTLHAYTTSVLTNPSGINLQYHTLVPPLNLDSNGNPIAYTLKKVWADLFYLGKQFVIAEFTPEVVVYYWMQSPAAWKAGVSYNINDTVQPSTPNGFYYKVANSQFPQAWQPGKNYAVGAVVVPTTLNGWKYTVITADGTNPSSGTTEPTWPKSNGATVTEEHDDTSTPTAPPAVPPSNPGGTRYGNFSGGSKSGTFVP